MKNSKIIKFFDIDETIFFTSAKIYVRNNNKIIKTLSNKEFNNYKLKKNEYFTFEEFKSSDIFIKNSIPNKKIINLINLLYNEGIEIALLTARQDFDDKDKLLNYLKSFGLNVGHYKNNEIHIIRAGNLKDIKSVAKRKQIAVSKILNKRKGIKEVELYDDNLENINSFLELNNKYKDKYFKGYLVNDNIKEIKNESN